jgi:hypothetical protein
VEIFVVNLFDLIYQHTERSNFNMADACLEFELWLSEILWQGQTCCFYYFVMSVRLFSQYLFLKSTLILLLLVF